MRSYSLLILSLLAGGLAWAVMPSASIAASAAWQAAPVSSSVYLQTSAIPAPVAPATTPPSQLGTGLPSSVLPHSGGLCSTLNPGAGSVCSINASAPNGVNCSARCDWTDTCSALILSSTPGDYGCSVYGGARRGCSVLPDQPSSNGVAACSVVRNFATAPGDRTWCSVIAPGTTTFCSAVNPNGQNPAGDPNTCSVLNAQPGNNESIQCSALLGGTSNRNFCSTLYAPGPEPKQCSVLNNPGAVVQCSVRPGQNALCTAFKNAPIGSCSVAIPSGHCSTIGGGGPNPAGYCNP